ncbi:unnamed protein product [Photorhabdus laumondii subsp. laumondii TTO1]|uniref:Photorhabdus luminescens subsp. laumondii TTO1 complete genome segment 6/17 n=1 Tax=Photorhabdus laumondii subsp. laumondii (strain DSM 15139 / CIP 105565 / TT01) TaxID=243265 RepID=Q7N658_PHOLL|nr:unnamed protein product [Photorhabdus laumondii subsp. laumondii TTO1]
MLFYELCSDAKINNKRLHQAHEHQGFDETEQVILFPQTAHLIAFPMLLRCHFSPYK